MTSFGELGILGEATGYLSGIYLYPTGDPGSLGWSRLVLLYA